jgi:predicted NUDIX family phosphoesterase
MSQCLVVKREILEKTDFWSRIPRNAEGKLFGFVKLKPQEINEFLEIIDGNREFKERFEKEDIEHRPEWQQIIFYGLIRQGDKFFAYQRGGKDSSYVETRLQGKIAVGVGGHIEPFDAGLIDSLYRELDEEVVFKKNGQEINLKNSAGKITEKSFTNLADIYITGLIKNELKEVDEVHLGLACEVKLVDPNLTVEIRPGENSEGKMMTLKEYQDWVEIKKSEAVPEDWTQIFIKEISKELKPPKGKERI